MASLRQTAAAALWMGSMALLALPLEAEASGKGSGGRGGHHGSIIVNQEVHRSGGHSGSVQPEGFQFNDIPRELFDDHGLDDGFHGHGGDDRGLDDQGSGRGRSR
jgi:hypothetical protein